MRLEVSQSPEWASQSDPFRLFFPLGLAYGIWAIGIWVPYAMGLVQTFPGPLHAALALRGFELSFVAGFLMTSLPRFTQTRVASKGELITAMALLVLPAVQFGFDAFSNITAAPVAALAFLAVFGLRRFRGRKINPPDSFVFVPAALVLGIVGSFLYDQSIGKALIHHGFIPALILGIGGRLIPGLLGWTEIVATQRARYEQPLPFLKVTSSFTLAILVLFLASFPIELIAESVGRSIRAGAIFAMAIVRWNLLKRPSHRTAFAWLVWAACWSFVVGSFCYALLPRFKLESEHVIFIGGYSLLTLLVASRVTLAHAGAGALDFEKRRWPYMLFAAAIFVSLVTRIFAAAVPSAYVSHLGYASAAWLFGIAIWNACFLPQCLRKQSKN